MAVYEFAVHDPDGFWGDLRQEAASAEEAEKLCREWLIDNEVEPNGSLVTPFCLELRLMEKYVVPMGVPVRYLANGAAENVDYDDD